MLTRRRIVIGAIAVPIVVALLVPAARRARPSRHMEAGGEPRTRHSLAEPSLPPIDTSLDLPRTRAGYVVLDPPPPPPLLAVPTPHPPIDLATYRPPLGNPGDVNGDRPARPVPGLD